MHLLYPYFLAASVATIIPIIVHLFNFRRYKKQYFPSIRFLQNVEKEHRSKSRIRQLVLLACRILTIVFAVIAFAYPYFPKNTTAARPGIKQIIVFLDNSFSMSQMGSEGSLIELAKKRAKEIALAYSDADQFALITNDFALATTHWLTRQEFLKKVDEVVESPDSHSFNDVEKRAATLGDLNSEKRFYVISDFQQGFVEPDIIGDTSLETSFILMESEKRNNVFIDSAWIESPVNQINRPTSIVVRIRNSSDKPTGDGTVTLVVNNIQKAIGNYSISSEGYQDVKLVFSPSDAGENLCKVSINDYPVVFDNDLYLSFNIKPKVPILIVNGHQENKYLEKAFSAENAFSVTNVNEGSIDYSTLAKYNLVIFNEIDNLSLSIAGVIKDYVDAGGNAMIIPSDNIDVGSYNTFLQQFGGISISGKSDNQSSLVLPDYNNPFFNDVFADIDKKMGMPVVRKYYVVNSEGLSRSDNLLKIETGSSFLTVIPEQKGNIFVTAVPINTDWSGFPEHSLFVPILYKSVFFTRAIKRIYHVIGHDNYILLPNAGENKEQIVHLTGDKFDVIPPQRVNEGVLSLFVEGLISKAGYYKLNASVDSSVVYSYNYNRSESVMNFLDEGGLSRMDKLNATIINPGKLSLTHEIQRKFEEATAWKLFLLLSLGFLLVETAIIRFWK